jgi:hypothetical protein
VHESFNAKLSAMYRPSKCGTAENGSEYGAVYW